MIITASVGTVVAVGVGLLGLLGIVSSESHDEGYNEGYKDGWSDASKVYEEKFIALSREAEEARGKILEQKRVLSKALNLITELEGYIEGRKAGGLIVEPEVALTYAETKNLAYRLATAA